MSSRFSEYTLLISARAKRAYRKLPQSHQDAILAALEEIQEDDPLIGKPLIRERTGQFSFRVGVYRIVYRINTQNKVIQVLEAGHRLTVYK